METVKIPYCKHKIEAEVTIPGCKSITNRVLVVAALADGVSVLENALFSDDTIRCTNCLQALGFSVESDSANSRIKISGNDGYIPAEEANLFVGNAGTTARFITSLVALGNGQYHFDGIPRMRERPMSDLLTVLQNFGTDVTFTGRPGFMPYTVHSNGFNGGHISLNVQKTSQQLSGLLMVAPYAKRDTTIELIGEPVSKPYISMTIQIMRDFGVEVIQNGWASFEIKARQSYTPLHYNIEPDASNASYFFAAAAITGGRVRVNGLSKDSLQGDAHFIELLADMGCATVVTDSYTELTGTAELKGIEVDMNGMSDMVQTLAAIAPFASSPVTMRNVEHIRWKETERIKAVVTELTRLGVKVEEFADGMKIYPADLLNPAEIETYDDHRMAMAFAVTGLKSKGLIIKNPSCTGKTFPDFFERFLGMVG